MVRSILAQTFTDFDLHVREDGATDFATADVLKQFDDPRLRYTRSEQQLGIPGVLNALLAEATGEFVMVLHDHDLCRPGYVAAYVAALDRYPDALYVFGGCDVVGQDGAHVLTAIRDDPPFTSGRDWLDVLLATPNCPVFACGLVRRAAYERGGLLDPEYGFVADVELCFRLATLGGVAYVPEPLIAFTEREADHEYRGINWTWMDAIARIHRRYGRHVRGGPAARLRHWRMLEQYLIGAYLTAIAAPGTTPERRAEARRHARRVGGLATNVVTWLR
jgi:GT2 family glycosyltransferase